MTDRASSQLLEYAAAHQSSQDFLTTSSGHPVGDHTISLTAGPKGPILLQDNTLVDSFAHLLRERIPERPIHTKGAGAAGYFEVTHDITQYTKATLFEKIGKRTKMFVRFSNAAGDKGTPDTARDIRGMAMKFYTEQGNLDILANNTPTFTLNDPILFPSFVHATKRNPVTNLADNIMTFDFFSRISSSIHSLMMLYSDRGAPDGYRFMHTWGANTFKFVNAQGEVHYARYNFRTNQGIKNLTNQQKQEISDPDYATRDLYNAIANGDYPTWTLYIQVMTEEESENVNFDPFDATKVWPQGEFELIPVGRVVLNRNPSNYFAEVEQVAFNPGHLIPGIEVAEKDTVLTARVFAYGETARHRLGPNHYQIPVNSPLRSNNYQRDGHMTVNNNYSGAPNYFPNSFNGPNQDIVYLEKEFKVDDKAARFPKQAKKYEVDDFAQPAVFWNKVLDEGARGRLVENLAYVLATTTDEIIQRFVNMYSKVSSDFGMRLSAAIIRIRTDRLKL